MPIKRTKPRKGARPMAYFKGSVEEFRSLNPKTIAKVLPKQRTGIRRLRTDLANRERQATSLKAQLEENMIALKQGGSATLSFECATGRELVWARLSKKGTLLITPMPLTHGVYGAFGDLLALLENGFRGKLTPNLIIPENKRERYSMFAMKTDVPRIAKGDSFTIEMIAPVDRNKSNFVKEATASQIVSVNVVLNPIATQAERETKIKLYKEQIQRRFGVPVKIIKSSLGKNLALAQGDLK